MLPFDPSSIPLAAVVAIFLGAAGVVWLTGTKLSGYAEAISERTGVGTAFIGALLLGGITSLPEVATTLSASIVGDADMAVNNIYGGVAMQVTVLALVDMLLRKQALSGLVRKPVIILQGVLLIAVLALSMAGMIVGEPDGLPVGPWAIAVLVAAVGAFLLMHRSEKQLVWRKHSGKSGAPEAEDDADVSEGDARASEPSKDRRGLGTLIGLSAVAAVVILAGGFILTRTGEAIATRTGLGSSFVGAALVAASTSMPELSTTVAAAKLGRFDMAFSNIFGANILDLSLIAVTDVAYQGAPVFDEMGDFALFGALLGIGVTAIFLASITHGRTRAVAGVGIDSLAVLAVYLGGLFVLFTLR